MTRRRALRALAADRDPELPLWLQIGGLTARTAFVLLLAYGIWEIVT